MQSPVSSLPDRWVEKIWDAMRATYGASFDRQWECPANVEPAHHVRNLMAHWGRELSRLQQNPQAIAFALEHLPPHPPNLVEFRMLCNRAPSVTPPALPTTAPDPERLSEALKRLAAVDSPRFTDAKAWALDLRRREATGRGGLTKFQKLAWREAFGLPANHPVNEPLERMAA